MSERDTLTARAASLPPSKGLPEFSLVLGGPLYQLWRRTHLSGDALELLYRRIIVVILLAWAPLLALSLAQGQAWGTSVRVPFLHDVAMYARLLLALPVLIAGELYLYERMRESVPQFLSRGLIAESARPKFDAAVASALRLRNSVAAELLLIAFVVVVGLGVVAPRQIAIDVANGVASWYGTPLRGRFEPTPAGWWLLCVSLPLFQFLLLRWYFRFFIWARFLWHVSRVGLQVAPMHPDRCGGVGFLGTLSIAFAPLLLAQGVLLAGVMAKRIFYSGAHLLDFRLDLAEVLAAMVLLILAPLLVLSPTLAFAKRQGRLEYGILAMDYVREFKRKWLRDEVPHDEPLIGSTDIQSLADLGNSYEVTQGMRLVPFDLTVVLQLAAITLVPILPLTLTLFSPEQLFEKVLGMLF
jgi:hypothetical protein